MIGIAASEAETLWCPFARVMFVTTGGGANRWQTKPDGTFILTPESARCVGPACAAWRWVEPSMPGPDAPPRSDDSPGFCGLAGEPR